MRNEKWAREINLLASVIARTPLEKTIKWGNEVFTWNGRNIVSYGSFKDFCSLWFFNGVFLEDRYQVLIAASEGKTKSLRQWRFTSEDEIDERKILEYIYEAIEIEKKGLKIKPEKFAPVAVPELLAEALEADVQLKSAFCNLSPGRQKEYILFLNEARQESTRRNRLDKIIPVILQGVGLNDRYKSGKAVIHKITPDKPNP